MAWALWRWLQPDDDAGGVGSLRWPAAAAGFFCLNALSGSHNAVFGALMAGLMIVYFGLADGRWRSRDFIITTLAFSLLCFTVLAPVFWPYLLVEEEMAAVRAETLDLPNSSLRPLELFSARSRFYSWLDETAGWPSILNPEKREVRAYAFPGVVALLLAICGVAATNREQRRQQSVWILALTMFVLLAMGAYGGYLLLGNVPLFRLIRVPTRFMMPAVFALGMLAAYGASACVRRVKTDARQAALLLLIGLLFAGEAAFAPLRTWPYEQQPRPLNEFFAEQPGDFAVVEFPLDPFGYAINMRQVYQSIFHWKRLLVGYSGFQSQANIDLLRRIRDRFPSDECLDELSRLDVRFVVLLADRVSTPLRQAVAAQPRLEPAWSQQGWLVYRVLPPGPASR